MYQADVSNQIVLEYYKNTTLILDHISNRNLAKFSNNKFSNLKWNVQMLVFQQF